MNGTQNLNIDAKSLEMCLKSVSSFGQTTYMNICTGAQSIVPWGSVDWTFAAFFTILGVAVIGGIVAFAYAMINDY